MSRYLFPHGQLAEDAFARPARPDESTPEYFATAVLHCRPSARVVERFCQDLPARTFNVAGLLATSALITGRSLEGSV